jgi:hypothetical protein
VAASAPAAPAQSTPDYRRCDQPECLPSPYRRITRENTSVDLFYKTLHALGPYLTFFRIATDDEVREVLDELWMPEPRPIRPTETLLLPTEVVALYGYVLRGPLTIHLNERSHQITINDYPLVLDPDEPGRLGGRVKSKIESWTTRFGLVLEGKEAVIELGNTYRRAFDELRTRLDALTPYDPEKWMQAARSGALAVNPNARLEPGGGTVRTLEGSIEVPGLHVYVRDANGDEVSYSCLTPLSHPFFKKKQAAAARVATRQFKAEQFDTTAKFLHDLIDRRPQAFRSPFGTDFFVAPDLPNALALAEQIARTPNLSLAEKCHDMFVALEPVVNSDIETALVIKYLVSKVEM